MLGFARKFLARIAVLAALATLGVAAILVLSSLRPPTKLARFEVSAAEVLGGRWFVPNGAEFEEQGAAWAALIFDRCRDIVAIRRFQQKFDDLTARQQLSLPPIQPCVDSKDSFLRPVWENPRLLEISDRSSSVPLAVLSEVEAQSFSAKLEFGIDDEFPAAIPIDDGRGSISIYTSKAALKAYTSSFQELVDNGAVVVTVWSPTPSELARMVRYEVAREGTSELRSVVLSSKFRDAPNLGRLKATVERSFVTWPVEVAGHHWQVELLASPSIYSRMRLRNFAGRTCVTLGGGPCPLQ